MKLLPNFTRMVLITLVVLPNKKQLSIFLDLDLISLLITFLVGENFKSETQLKEANMKLRLRLLNTFLKDNLNT
jgi:hypothetical protein